MKLLGSISAKRFSVRPFKKMQRKTLKKAAKRAISNCLRLYGLFAIVKNLFFFNVFAFPPKNITRRGKARYKYKTPYPIKFLSCRNKHGNIPTVADKKIFLKFFVLKFLSIVFIKLHHFLRENSFMISQPHQVYKEKLL